VDEPEHKVVGNKVGPRENALELFGNPPQKHWDFVNYFY